MKKIYLPAAIALLVITACHSPQTAPVQQQEEPPKALQENDKSYSLVSKSRSDDNLVEELYNELVEKTPALDSLEKSIDRVTESKKDSAAAYNLFNQKNHSFYNEAAGYTGRITDSAVKLQIKQLLDNSNNSYKNKTSVHNNLLEALTKKDIKLADLHIVLKLIKTIAVMEKYQNDHLPSVKPLQAVANQYDKVTTQTESLSKQ